MRTPSSSQRTWRTRTWRGPGIRWLLTASLLVITGLILLLIAAGAGFNRGLADRQQAVDDAVKQRLTVGMEHLQAGNAQLAAAYFQQALQLDPENSQAQSYLDTIQTATPVATLPGVPLVLIPPDTNTPTPTLATTIISSASLLSQAQAAQRSKDWELMTEILDELALLDPDYEIKKTDEMRFNAFVQQGQTAVKDRRLEEALRFFDQALVIEPDNTDIETVRSAVALYADALGSWRLDWPAVISDLQAIQKLEPDFLDVSYRLRTAYEAYGDALIADGEWCDAADQYTVLLKLAKTDALQAKHTQAQTFCLTPPTTTAILSGTITTAITGTVTAGTAGTLPAAGTPVATTPTAAANGAGGATGNLVFATLDTQTGSWNIYRQPARGGQVQLVTGGASQPQVSPNGSNIAVRSERGDQAGLTAMTINGSNQYRVTTYTEDAHPHFSPDGGQVVFESQREGDRSWRIYTVSLGGGEGFFLDFGRWPAWSPGGGSIVYQGCQAGTGRCGLLLIGPGGGNSSQLTTFPGDAMPDWSPDGTRLAFASADRSGGWDLYVLDMASGNITTLVASAGVDAHPAWSPDGRQIAYISNQDGVWATYIVNAAGGQSQKVATLPGTIPDWYEMQLDWTW